MSLVLSGIQPTNQLHLGNYLGALRHWVKLQHQHQSFLFIADLHAITVPQEPEHLRRAVREVAAAYIAAGIDSNYSNIFVQSQVPQHSELMWLLATLTPLGWLNRMTQFKEKAGKDREIAGLGLYAYPVLQAADILVYRASHVPVGEDQKQHLELARDIAGAFNHRFGEEFLPLPEPLIMGQATRVMSLRDGTKKMSKSDASDYAKINLTDNDNDIAQKIRKAKTDPLPLPDTLVELETRPEANNLVTIFAEINDSSKQEVLEKWAGKNFSEFKPALADALVAHLAPIRQRMNDLLTDHAHLDAIMEKGAEKARAVAGETLHGVRKLMGFL
ncbi:MAG: tryptophan--tRNA ligase [Alphaproteobacteria bacterium]